LEEIIIAKRRKAAKNKKPKKGIKMTKGSKWRLKATKGREREFAGTLIQTFNFGAKRLAIFSVPKK
jgi:hypothetical protein